MNSANLHSNSQCGLASVQHATRRCPSARLCFSAGLLALHLLILVLLNQHFMSICAVFLLVPFNQPSVAQLSTRNTVRQDLTDRVLPPCRPNEPGRPNTWQKVSPQTFAFQFPLSSVCCAVCCVLYAVCCVSSNSLQFQELGISPIFLVPMVTIQFHQYCSRPITQQSKFSLLMQKQKRRLFWQPTTPDEPKISELGSFHSRRPGAEDLCYGNG